MLTSLYSYDVMGFKNEAVRETASYFLCVLVTSISGFLPFQVLVVQKHSYLLS